MAPKASFLLTAFADEISPDIEVQVKTLNRLQIQGLDLRSVEGVNVLALSEDQLTRLENAVEAEGLHIQCIGSPVNKISLDPSLEIEETKKLHKAIEIAHRLGVKRIRVFSPETDKPDDISFSGAVIEWMSKQKAVAKSEDVILLHENDAKFWGAYPEQAKLLLNELGDETFRAAFDFANTTLLGFRAMKDWFPWILPYLDTIHIKDAKEGHVVAAGEGDSGISETIQWLIEQGWNGPLTLEPHLTAAGPLGGFSGPQLFEHAVVSLRKVLTEVGADA